MCDPLAVSSVCVYELDRPNWPPAVELYEAGLVRTVQSQRPVSPSPTVTCTVHLTTPAADPNHPSPHGVFSLTGTWQYFTCYSLHSHWGKPVKHQRNRHLRVSRHFLFWFSFRRQFTLVLLKMSPFLPRLPCNNADWDLTVKLAHFCGWKSQFGNGSWASDFSACHNGDVLWVYTGVWCWGSQLKPFTPHTRPHAPPSHPNPTMYWYVNIQHVAEQSPPAVLSQNR